MFRHCFFLLLISTRTAMELLGPLTLACMSVASLLRVFPLLLCARPWSLLLIRVLCSVVSSSLQPCGLWPARLLCPWGLSRQKYWSGLPCPPPRGLPNPGIEPRSPTLQADSLPAEPQGKPSVDLYSSLILSSHLHNILFNPLVIFTYYIFHSKNFFFKQVSFIFIVSYFIFMI